MILEGAVPGKTSEPAPLPDDWQEALAGKGDNLTLSGQNLELRSRERVLSSVELPEGGASQDVYSLEEQVVGRWIDGRPLYSRTYLLETKENRTDLFWENLNIPIEDVDKVIDISATIRSQDLPTAPAPRTWSPGPRPPQWRCGASNHTDMGGVCHVKRKREAAAGAGRPGLVTAGGLYCTGKSGR